MQIIQIFMECLWYLYVFHFTDYSPKILIFLIIYTLQILSYTYSMVAGLCFPHGFILGWFVHLVMVLLFQLLCNFFALTLRVLERDLRIWDEKGGISEENLKAAIPLGIHYQIINHKLYRQDDCMFPFR